MKLTALTSPVSPTSPVTAIVSSTATFLKLDAIAITIPKSIEGSFIFIPPTILRYTSWFWIWSPTLFSKTANNIPTLL